MSGIPADGWNHNAHYHARLLQWVPQPCPRALDVGCGLGTFARRLSPMVGRLDALEKDATAIRQARAWSIDSSNIHFIDADFMTWTSDDAYDFISMIAVLHHLPFDAALTKAAGLLRPGGSLVVLGLDRAPSLLHAAARSLLVAYPASAFYRATRHTSLVGAPIMEPTMTLNEIRREAVRLLPGAVVRRHILWRYSLVWTKR